MSLFHDVIAKIEHEYIRLGHQLGWRFLGVKRSNLSPSTKILLITANPGGDYIPKDHATASCEKGSAYIVERWKDLPPGQESLQKQVRSLFSAISGQLNNGTEGDDLLEQSLIAYFIPFRSPELKKLTRPQDSFAFASKLWAQIFLEIRPRLVITIDTKTYPAIREIISNATGAPIVASSFLPTGWGSYQATLDEFRSQSYQSILVRLPHLSRFKLFTRLKCHDSVHAILARACVYL